MKATIIGLGLIGGSMALDLKKAGLVTELTGIDLNKEHAAKALELGLVTAIDTEGKTIATADLIIISIPVSVLSQLLPSILDSVKKDAVVSTPAQQKAWCAKRYRIIKTAVSL
jgi:prephenate dehydrogenase